MTPLNRAAQGFLFNARTWVHFQECLCHGYRLSIAQGGLYRCEWGFERAEDTVRDYDHSWDETSADGTKVAGIGRVRRAWMSTGVT